MKKLFVILIVFFLVLFAAAPLAAQAEGLIPCGGEGEPACNFCHLFELGNNIVTFLLIPSGINNAIPLVPVVAGLLIALGGFFMLFGGGGNLAHVERGKQILGAVFIGLIIIYGAWLFLSLALSIGGPLEWQGITSPTWWSIECAF